MLAKLSARTRQNLQTALGACLLVIITACSGDWNAPAQPSENDMKRLEQRVAERWDAMSARDFGRVWEYTTPNFREVFSKDMFRHKFSYAVDWELTGVEVVNYDAPAAVASVVSRVMTRSTKLASTTAFGVGAVPVDFREQWIFIDGEWWYSANR